MVDEKLVNYTDFKKTFLKKGYFICNNVFNKKFIKKILQDIDNAKNTIKYLDNNNNLRRVEKLYDKGIHLKELNKKISILLNKIFKKKFLIFKDKFNAKPPGGEGFFAHFDGIFNFTNEKNQKKRGWYEYGDFFINALVALDECNKKNGSIEISNVQKGSFSHLIKKTKNDGTPALKRDVEKKLSFDLIHLNIGDVVIFSHKCPHRSKTNNTNHNRRILYYTYSPLNNGSKYKQYFKDKKNSKNKSKALVEKK
jgi:ectoine hydroxylase-related dioxygenase (phytanoyl-CoA dioxygenase family)